MKQRILEQVIQPLREYTLDQQELGKILIIFSLTLIILSSYGVYQLSEVQKMTESNQEDLRGVNLIVQSERFEDSVQSLERSGMTIDGQPISQVAEEFSYMANTSENVRMMDQRVSNTKSTFQWLVMIGVLGVVAGITVMYV